MSLLEHYDPERANMLVMKRMSLAAAFTELIRLFVYLIN